MSSSKVSQITKLFTAFLKGLLQSNELTQNLTKRIEIMLFYINRYPLDSDKMEIYSHNSNSNEFLENFIKENSLDVLIFGIKEILSQRQVNQKDQPQQIITQPQATATEIQQSQSELLIKDYIKNMTSSKSQKKSQDMAQQVDNYQQNDNFSYKQSPIGLENNGLLNQQQEDYYEIDSLNNKGFASRQSSQKFLNIQAKQDNNFLLSSESLQQNYLKSAFSTQNALKSVNVSLNQLDAVLNDTSGRQNEMIAQNQSANQASPYQLIKQNQVEYNTNNFDQNGQQEKTGGQFQQFNNIYEKEITYGFQKIDQNQINLFENQFLVNNNPLNDIATLNYQQNGNGQQNQINQTPYLIENQFTANKISFEDTAAQNLQPNANNQYNYLQYGNQFVQQDQIESQEGLKTFLNSMLLDVRQNIQIMRNHTQQYNQLIEEYHQNEIQKTKQANKNLVAKYNYNFQAALGQNEQRDLDLNQQMKKSLKNIILYTRRDSIKTSFYSIERDLQKKMQQTKNALKHNNEKRAYINVEESQQNQNIIRGQQIESLVQKYMINRQKSNNAPQNNNVNNNTNNSQNQNQKIDQQLGGNNQSPPLLLNQFQLNPSSYQINNQEFNQYQGNTLQQNQIEIQPQNQQIILPQQQQQVIIQPNNQELSFSRKNDINSLASQFEYSPPIEISKIQAGLSQSKGQQIQIPQVQQQEINYQQVSNQNYDYLQQQQQQNEIYQAQQLKVPQLQIQSAIYQQQQLSNQDQQQNNFNYFQTQQLLLPQPPVIFEDKQLNLDQQKNIFDNQQAQQFQLSQIQQQYLGFEQLQPQIQELQKIENNYQNSQQNQYQGLLPPVVYQYQQNQGEEQQNNQQYYQKPQNQDFAQEFQQSPTQLQIQQNQDELMQLQPSNLQQYLQPTNNQRKFQTEIHRSPNKNQIMQDFNQNSFLENNLENDGSEQKLSKKEQQHNHYLKILELEKNNTTKVQDYIEKMLEKKNNQNQFLENKI